MDDYAAMLATLEQRMAREDIAVALGVDQLDLDEIESGYAPNDEVAARLRALASSGASRTVMRIPVWAIVLFVAVDTLIFAGIAVYLFTR